MDLRLGPVAYGGVSSGILLYWKRVLKSIPYVRSGTFMKRQVLVAWD